MFYVLTCGATASVWLARALCRHPDIVCFHGKRTIGLAPPGDSPACDAPQLVRELTQLNAVAEGEKVFGSIHGHGFAEIVPEIAAARGFLAAMIRHPVTRINSFFHQQARGVGAVDLPAGDIYAPLRDADLLPADADGIAAQAPPSPYARLFSALCNSVMGEDTFILQNMDRRLVFQYEKIVVDPEYFRTCFEILGDGCRCAMALLPHSRKAGRPHLELACTSRYLETVFTMGTINARSTGAGAAEAVFARWPDAFKRIFVRHLETQGGADAVARYAEFGYRLPDDARHLLDARSPTRDRSRPPDPAPACRA